MLRDTPHPAGTHARRILDRMLIDLSWSSSRLEGNTYSLLDTKRLIELGEPAAGRDIRETQMILNHKHAIEFLVESVDDIAFDRRTVLNLHGILADNLLPDPAARYGAIRQSVGEPDPFRLRHREALRQIVGEIVRNRLNVESAARRVAAWAEANMEAGDRARFIETAETELLGLHEGNYARHRVSASEYDAWRKGLG